MSSNKVIILVVAIAAAAYYFLKVRKPEAAADVTTTPAPPAPPPPAPAPGTGSTGQLPTLAGDEPARTAILNRAKALYNSAERENVFSRNNTRENIFSGLQYKAGVRSVLAQNLATGNAEQFPLIPDFINPAYLQRLEAAADLRGFEAMTQSGQFDLAVSLWRSTLDLSDVGGPNLWPTNIVQILDAGLFYVSGGADRNKSERYDSYCKDMAKLFSNAAAATRSAAAQFRAQAIEDLNRGGWKIV